MARRSLRSALVLGIPTLGALGAFLVCREPAAPPVRTAPGAREPEGALRRAWPVAPAGALPFVEPLDGYSQLLGRYVHEGLARVDSRTGRVEPALASKLDVSPDGKVVTATLRDGLVFHDGSPIAADDVVATFEAVRKFNAPTSSVRLALADLESIATPAPTTIAFSWAKASARALRILADVVIIPAKVARGGVGQPSARRDAPGAGPFRLTRFTDDEIVIERFDRYAGERPNLDAAVFKIIPKLDDQLAAFADGRLDLVAVPPHVLDTRRDSLAPPDRVRVLEYPRTRFDLLLFNTARKPFSDARLRRAVVRLLDRRELAALVTGVRVQPIAGPVLPGVDGFLGFATPAAADPAGAKTAIAQLKLPPGGQAKGEPLLLLVTDGSPLARVATAVRDRLATVGLKVEVRAMATHAMRPALQEGAFDLAFFQDQASYDLDYAPFFRSGGRENFTRLANPSVDALFDQVAGTVDFDERGKLYARMEPLLAADAPAVWLWRQEATVLVGKRLEGVEPSPLTGIDDIRRWHVGRQP